MASKRLNHQFLWDAKPSHETQRALNLQWVLLSLLLLQSAEVRVFRSVAQSCLTLCDCIDCSTPGFPVPHQLPELAQTHVIESVIPSNHLILCRPLLPPSVFPSIRVFPSESVLPIRRPKYWGFSFSISPSNEYSGLIAFRIDWFDLFAVQGTLKSLPPTPQIFSCSIIQPEQLYSIIPLCD